jgi:hypothetical protein
MKAGQEVVLRFVSEEELKELFKEDKVGPEKPKEELRDK